MGYSLWLKDKRGDICEGKEKRYDLGNMLAIGGTKTMSFNITYNYSPYYYEADGFEKEGIRIIYGKTGKQSLPLLRKLSAQILKKYFNASKNRWKQTIRQKKVAVVNGEVLPINSDEFLEYPEDQVEWKEIDYICDEGDTGNYWKATAKNAFRAVQRLIEMAEECPEGVWCGD